MGKKVTRKPTGGNDVKRSPPPGMTKRGGRDSNRNNGKLSAFGTAGAAVVAVGALLAVGTAIYLMNQVGGDTTQLHPLIPPPFNVDELSWGAHRAQHYFGLRMRHERSPLFGLMWFEQPREMRMPSMRHWANQGDGIHDYAWTKADGRSFGTQNINDTTFVLKTDWISTSESSFTARVTSIPHKKGDKRRISFFFYLAFENPSWGKLLPDISENKLAMHGSSAELGNFRMDVDFPKDKVLIHDMVLTPEDVSRVHDYVMNSLASKDSEYGLAFVMVERGERRDVGNVAILQVNAPVDSTFEDKCKGVEDLVIFASGDGRGIGNSIFVHQQSREGKQNALRSKDFDTELEKRIKKFEDKFESAFGLAKQSLTSSEQRMAHVALSNMLGSIGVWRGYNKVQVKGNSGPPVLYGPHYLLSCVPSRPFFPRGFLWDEGFHQLLVSKFDRELSLEIIVSWLNTMNVNGWIPREMILGAEAEAKVPAEFVVQRPDVANPPSFFIILESITKDDKFVHENAATFERIYERLAKWYWWLIQSQAGLQEDTFRWRGRNATTVTELNPKTLPSGLDDYPRASHPSDTERHVDLRCWLALASRVMERLARRFGTESQKKEYGRKRAMLEDWDSLVKLHWSEEKKMFADYGRHSFHVRLEPKMDRQGNRVYERRVLSPPQETLVTDAFGYVSLFPLLMRLVPAESSQMSELLKRINHPDELWTPYGIRSISTHSPYYREKNTEHDNPYWRGAIWMPINYLLVTALRDYALEPDAMAGPNGREIARTHDKLRAALVDNIGKEFARTGFLWEHYNDVTGRGEGSYPMTGWTSLILQVLSEPALEPTP